MIWLFSALSILGMLVCFFGFAIYFAKDIDETPPEFRGPDDYDR